MNNYQGKKVIVVDARDKVLGDLGVIEAHEGRGVLHRAVSVFLFNDDGKLLVQKRSAGKIVAAGLWANTACGNVQPGESYEQCALRRLNQELGITGVKLNKICKFRYQVSFSNGFSEKEIDTVFVGVFNKEPQLNLEEVSEAKWVELPVFRQQVNQESTTQKFAPWVKILLSQPELNRYLAKYE